LFKELFSIIFYNNFCKKEVENKSKKGNYDRKYLYYNCIHISYLAAAAAVNIKAISILN
jgi:hypothetical protein